MNVDDSAIHPNAELSRTSPLATTARVPMRLASATPPTEPIAIVIATGRIRTPVDRVPKPRMNWKYCVTRKMNPNRAKNASVSDEDGRTGESAQARRAAPATRGCLDDRVDEQADRGS